MLCENSNVKNHGTIFRKKNLHFVPNEYFLKMEKIFSHFYKKNTRFEQSFP